MRILYVLPYPFGDDGVANRAAQVRSDLLAPGTEVICRPVRNAAVGDTHFETLLNDAYVVDAAMAAEEQGFDGVIMDTVSDSGLQALRSRLSIPVLGPGLVGYQTALMLGTRFVVVTMCDEWVPLHERNLTTYGLWAHCAGVRSIGVAPDVTALLEGKVEEVARLIAEQAQAAIDHDGADVLVLGSTTMHQSELTVRELISAPVVNPGPLSIKLMETVIQFGLAHSKVRFPGPAVNQDALFAMLAGGSG
jgi:allantoin racemase